MKKGFYIRYSRYFLQGLVDELVSSTRENDAAITARSQGGVSTAILLAADGWLRYVGTGGPRRIAADSPCPAAVRLRGNTCTARRSRCLGTFTSARCVRNAIPKGRERAPARGQHRLHDTLSHSHPPVTFLKRNLNAFFHIRPSWYFQRELSRYWGRAREGNVSSPRSRYRCPSGRFLLTLSLICNNLYILLFNHQRGYIIGRKPFYSSFLLGALFTRLILENLRMR